MENNLTSVDIERMEGQAKGGYIAGELAHLRQERVRVLKPLTNDPCLGRCFVPRLEDNSVCYKQRACLAHLTYQGQLAQVRADQKVLDELIGLPGKK